MAVPIVSTASTTSRTRSAPKRCAIRGANGAKTPRQTTGSVVNIPAAIDDMPVASMISGKSTETLENTGRRLAAMSTRLKPSKMRIALLGGCWTGGGGTLSASASTSASGCIASFSAVSDRAVFVWLMMRATFQVLQSGAP